MPPLPSETVKRQRFLSALGLCATLDSIGATSKFGLQLLSRKNLTDLTKEFKNF
jgi:hypothetical protein